MTILIIVLIIPQLIYTYIQGYSILTYINSYFSMFFKGKIILCLNFSGLKEIVIQFLTYWIPEDTPLYLTNYFRNNQLIYSFYFIFAIMGLFIPIKKEFYKSKYAILLCKYSVLFTSIVFFVPLIVPFLIENIIPLWIILRTLEIFYVPVVIIECYGIHYLLDKLKFLGNYLRMHRLKLNFSSILNKVAIIILILSCVYLNISNYNKRNSIITPNYYFNDDKIELIFFINNRIPEGSNLLVHNYTTESYKNILYKLLYNYNCSYLDFSEKSYSETIKFANENKIEYIVIYKDKINSTNLDSYLNSDNLTIILQNDIDIIFKY